MSARILPAWVTCLLGFCLLAGTARAQLTYESAQIVTTNFIIMTVQYAYDGEDVKFAVFHRSYGEPGLKCDVVYSVRGGRSTPLSATLKLHDKTPRDLLQEGGVFRVDSGFVQPVAVKFKTSELKEFLEQRLRRTPARPGSHQSLHPATEDSAAHITIDDFFTHLRRKNV